VSVSRLARLAVIAPALMVAAAALGGCGAATPGVAAEVGDDTITIDEVDGLASDLCALLEDVPDGDPNLPDLISGERARNSALQSQIFRSIADQMADDYGVETGQDFQRQVDQVRLRFGSVDEDKLEAALPAFTSFPYFVDIMRQVGGTTDDDLSDDEALNAGVGLAREWEAEHGVETNPLFDSFRIGEQEIESERSDLGFGVSESAKGAEDGSDSYVSSLPESQRCG
jgi:hypothetical protein